MGGKPLTSDGIRIAGSFKMADGGHVIWFGKPLTLVGKKRIAGSDQKKRGHFVTLT